MSGVPTTYATIDDIRDAWNSFDSSMEDQADKLLVYAAALIDHAADAAGVDVDSIPAVLKELVSVDMVRMTLLAETRNSPDIKSEQWSAGPYVRNVSYMGMGGIWMTQNQLSTLGLSDAQTITVLKPVPSPSIIGGRTIPWVRA